MSSSRQKLRKEKRCQRRLLTFKQQMLAAQAVERRLTQSAVFRNASRIGCYLAHDGELDLSLVMSRIFSMKKYCYLPVLDRLGSKRLWFAPLHSQTNLQMNRFDIPEPSVSPRKYIRASALDLMLLPLVAFDLEGNRLGMGGGFYDVTLNYLQRRQHWYKPHLYGVAHEFQRVEQLTCAHWDIPLQGIVTDQRIHRVCE